MERGARKCHRCNMFVPASSYHKHLQDKRHRIREKRFNEMMHNSVFISNLPGNIDQYVLMEVLSNFGKVRSCSIFPRSTNAVAEFEQRVSAEKCLRGPVYVGGVLVKTSPRKEPKQKDFPAPPQECDVDHTELISVIEEARSRGVTDTDKLIELTVQTVRLQDPQRGHKMLMLQRDLEECISELIPGCRAHPFGSAVTGVPLRGSDADIVMVLPEEAARNCDIPQLVKRLRKLLWGFRRRFGSIVPISEARIPIVKLVHIPTGIACDLSFQGLGCVIKSKQLSSVLDIDARIRPLIIFLKYWEKCHNIISVSRFSSYAATLMVVFFLQQPPDPIILPIRDLLQPAFQGQNITAKNNAPLSKLAENFFRYYSEADFSHHVICPWTGYLVPHEAFIETPVTTFSEDIENLRKLTLPTGNLEISTALVIQDPYQLDRNVTERVKEKDLVFFRLCCAKALEIMKKGDPALLFKNFNVPSEVNESATLNADQFLTTNVLGPVDTNDIASREILFTRWLSAVVGLLPEILTKLARLKVEPCDDTSGPALPHTPTSKDGNIAQLLPRSWKCSGKPVLHTWKMRTKVITKLKLFAKLTMMDRETRISEYLEQEASENEAVSFTFRVSTGGKKESVRCSVIVHTANTGLYQLVGRRLLSLIPLWVRDAFDSGTALNYIPGYNSASSRDVKSGSQADISVCESTEQSSVSEESVVKVDMDQQDNETSSSFSHDVSFLTQDSSVSP